MPDKPKLRWYQYSLRSLFVLMTLVAFACSWYAYEMQKAAERRAIITEVFDLGGVVYYLDDRNPRLGGRPPAWFSLLRRVHGDEHLGNVVGVAFSIYVAQSYRPKVSDADLPRLRDLPDLEVIDLNGADITDIGLGHLKSFTNLKALYLENTQITDDGLANLRGLTKLDKLSLSCTQTTDAGIVNLEGMKKLTELGLGRTQITDAGLVHIEGFTKLKRLGLWRTQVTDEGVKKLQKALPNCKINR